MLRLIRYGQACAAVILLTLISHVIAEPNDQSAKPPSGEEVLDKCAVASGGNAAYEKLKNRVSTGEVVTSSNTKGKIVVTEAPPNLLRSLLELEGLGKAESGNDGTTVWEMSDTQGPRIVEGEERELAMRQSTFNWITRWKTLYSRVENVGEETIGDAKCWKLEMTPRAGAPETWFVDQGDFLLRRMSFVQKHPAGEFPVKVTFSDFRNVDGVMIPFTAVTEMIPVQMTTKLQEVKHNVDLPKDAFALPEAVRELKNKPTSKPAGTADKGKESAGEAGKKP